MSLANWTTRLMVGSAQGSDMQPDGQSPQSGSNDAQGEPSPRAAPQSFVGRRVGAYLITKRLGAGGVGEVFKGHDVMLKREVAIKVLRDELASDPIFLARFHQEAQLHGKLSHLNVASVHAFLHEGDKQFLVMEYVAGISLDEFIRTGGPVPVERALSIFRRALDGIEHAHHCGIVHRDIKPANIMLADNGQVKVMDFGIARALDSQEHLTRLGQVAGTARSMSPEQIRGGQADVRSDVYSLGIVLYTLLAGRAPFDGANDHALMRAQLEQAPPPLRALVKNLPPMVEAAVMRALEKDPSARFQTVGEFSRAINACLAEPKTTSPAAPNRPDLTKSPRTVLNPTLQDGQEARTVVNPALQDAQRSKSGDASRAAQKHGMLGRHAAALQMVRSLDRRIVAGVMGLLALSAATALVWPQFAHHAAPAVVSLAPIAVAPPASQQETAPPAPPVEEHMAAAQVAAPPVQEQAPAAIPQPTLSPPITAPVMARSLSIIRPPSDDQADAVSGTDATYRFKPGEHVKLLVTTSHDAHVYCYLQDETRRILRFYPNRFSKSPLVKTDAPLEFPGKMRFEIVANTRNVAETVACFASERDVMAELPSAVVGTDFASLSATSLDEVRSAFARVAGDTLTEASFRVEFK
jgi:serine/threonine protein kinase